jgi:hypothetical protein
VRLQLGGFRGSRYRRGWGFRGTGSVQMKVEFWVVKESQTDVVESKNVVKERRTAEDFFFVFLCS